MVRNTVIFLGPTPFPADSAASRRILGNALAVNELGYNVIVGGGQMCESDEQAYFEFDGLTVYPIGERTSEKSPKLLKQLKYVTMGKKTIEWLNSMDATTIKAVILYSGYSPFLLKLLPWCRKRNIPLVFDAVEWYEPTNPIRTWIDPYYLNIELAMRRLLVKTKNIIAISSHLENHYAARGCTTVRIPPILDSQKMEYRLEANANKRKVISYTGIPGHKDLFNNYLEAILTVDPEGKQMVLHVAGVSEEQVLKFPAFRSRNITKVPLCIIAEGFVPHARAFEVTREADFSVLQRTVQRYTNAGFPTKIVESLSCGTPVIINYTSDLGDHITDEKEGIVCKDSSTQSLVEALKRVLALPKKQILQMRYNARKRAEKSFDFRKHTTAMKSFIEQISQ